MKKKQFTLGYELSARKRCWPTFLSNKKWIHFKDTYNGKTLSFDINEIKRFMRYVPRIEKCLHKLEVEDLKNPPKTEAQESGQESSKGTSSEDISSSSSDSE